MAFELTEQLIDELGAHPHLRGNLFGFHLFPDELDFEDISSAPPVLMLHGQRVEDGDGGAPLGAIPVRVSER